MSKAPDSKTASVHCRHHGTGRPVVFLPPAPHDGSYFDALIPHLTTVEMLAFDYPGYGQSAPIETPSIEAYAEALAPHIPADATLVGFHTGNLVAAEIAKRRSVAGIIMIDIPYFDEQTRAKYAAGMDRNARNAAFQAAFAYDPQAGLDGLTGPVRVIATQSSLTDLTIQAAEEKGWPLTQRMDITKPVFDAHPYAMATTILELLP